MAWVSSLGLLRVGPGHHSPGTPAWVGSLLRSDPPPPFPSPRAGAPGPAARGQGRGQPDGHPHWLPGGHHPATAAHHRPHALAAALAPASQQGGRGTPASAVRVRLTRIIRGVTEEMLMEVWVGCMEIQGCWGLRASHHSVLAACCEEASLEGGRGGEGKRRPAVQGLRTRHAVGKDGAAGPGRSVQTPHPSVPGSWRLMLTMWTVRLGGPICGLECSGAGFATCGWRSVRHAGSEDGRRERRAAHTAFSPRPSGGS